MAKKTLSSGKHVFPMWFFLGLGGYLVYKNWSRIFVSGTVSTIFGTPNIDFGGTKNGTSGTENKNLSPLLYTKYPP